MTAKQHDEQSQELESKVSDLWSVMNIYGCNYWFLGVDQATEVTESFKDQDGHNMGESFAAEVKVRYFSFSKDLILKLYDELVRPGFF